MPDIIGRDIKAEFVRLGANGPVLEILPNANAGAVLFYPGTMQAPGHYFILMRALFQAGFCVAGLHLKGHGLCRGGFCKLDTFTFEELLEQGLAAEAWLHKQGLGPVAVCGHSQGGIMALAHSARSKSLQAVFPITGVLPQMPEAISLTLFHKFQDHRPRIMRCLGKIAKIFPRLPVPLPFYLNLGRVIAGRKKPIIMGGDAGRATYPLLYLYSFFDAVIPQAMNCPVYLMSAANDALFTKELMLAVFNALPAPAKEIIFLPEGGHMAVYNEYLAQYMARAMAAYCAGIGFPINTCPNGDRKCAIPA